MGLIFTVTHKNEDAEQKWCPFSWAGNSGPGWDDVTGSGKKLKGRNVMRGRRCLTTGCMAWIDETDHVHEIPMGRCGLVSFPAA